MFRRLLFFERINIFGLFALQKLNIALSVVERRENKDKKGDKKVD